MTVESPMAASSSVAVIGCGLMGAGIAQICIQSGYKVSLYGRNEGKLTATRDSIRKGVQRVAMKKMGPLAADQEHLANYVNAQMDLLSLFTEVESAVQDAWIVIEAIAENLQQKLELFERVQTTCSRNTLLITNTSSLKLSQMLPCIERPENFAGLHFFNPVPLMKLVEVVATEETSEETLNTLRTFCTKIGKKYVDAKDTPGFIVNRLLIPFLIDSIRMVERGDATKEDVDAAMKCGTSHPMGPIELCDYVGLDTLQSTLDIFRESVPGDQRFDRCELLDQLVSEGKLGKKTKQGFYTY